MILASKNNMSYTKEQKQAYFKNLREEWKKSKELADNDKEAEALHRESCGQMSYYSFYYTLVAMRKLKLSGIPYVDCKTFNRWKESGFIVKKGEKSKIKGITWIKSKNKDGEEDPDAPVYPKLYNLFHRTQVEAIEIKE